MSNIETLGTRIAKAMIKGEEAKAKADESTLDKVCSEVIKAAKAGITKPDLKQLRASIIAQYVEAGNSEDSAKVQASQVMRLVKVAANLDKKLSEYHEIKTVEDGVLVLETAQCNTPSLRLCYEYLAIPKADDVASDEEATAETKEPTASEASEIGHLFSEFMQKAFDNGHTKMEIAHYLAQVSIDLHREAS